jgi:uncharacterized membrane protein
MARHRNQSLGGRADRAGLVVAAINAPLTFQRTLMPRNSMDQALVTGLSASANHALITLVQESIQSAALVLSGQTRGSVDSRRWGRATLFADAAAVALGLGMQRALPQRDRERLPRASVRAAGFWLAAAGTAGGVVGAFEEARSDNGSRMTTPAALEIAATGAVAGANAWWIRRRARLDADRPPEEIEASVLKSAGYGVGVALALSGFGRGERALADVLSRGLARALPGNAQLWRPVAHAATLTAFGYGVKTLAEKTLHRIESTQESVEAAFDVPPPNELLSGSYESLVPFDSLSRAGRRYVWMACATDVLSDVMQEPAVAMPIRAYVGLESGETDAERVDLAMRELERTNAFEREWLMVACPTGTGYINYAAVTILEMLTRGNCATIAMQYAARPSPISLDRVAEGRGQARMFFEALNARLAECPAAKRPKVLLFGESLGAWTSQDAFVERGTQGLLNVGIDYAIWIGTPHFSKWKERVLYDDRDNIDASLVAVCNDIAEWEALPEARRERVRFVMITHHDDGVAVFGPELLVQSPPWLGAPATRPAEVPKGMRWVPSTTFFQVLVDMKNAANVVPGVFAAKGHDYRADLLPFFHSVLGLKATPTQLDRVKGFLESRELLRSQWMQTHGKVGKSLAATVLDRLIQEERAAGRDTNDRLLRTIRAVAHDEFDAAGGVSPTAP